VGNRLSVTKADNSYRLTAEDRYNNSNSLTYPPILGTVGRATGQVRRRMVKDTKGQTLREHVHQFIYTGTPVYTDECASYNQLHRSCSTVCHGANEWARDDDDGDGIREVHTNTIERLWTGLLRPCRGVSKHFLSGYVALYEFQINLIVFWTPGKSP
jgi:transposase